MRLISLLTMRTDVHVLQILIFFNGVWLVLFWAVSLLRSQCQRN